MGGATTGSEILESQDERNFVFALFERFCQRKWLQLFDLRQWMEWVMSNSS
jgi:hypothetical protein